MPTSDLVRYAFLTLVSLVMVGFGLNLWDKKKTGKRIVTELRAHMNPTASFEQFYAEDTARALFQAMYQLHLGEVSLKKPPHVLLDLAFEKKGAGNLFGTATPDAAHELDPRELLVRSALLRNYENCKRLGAFNSTISREALARGEPPRISSGPAEGESVRIRYIIDPAVSPGAEKIAPNLVISPPSPESGPPNQFEIAQARNLAHELQRAGLLESTARDRIIRHYDSLDHEGPIPAKPDPPSDASRQP